MVYSFGPCGAGRRTVRSAALQYAQNPSVAELLRSPQQFENQAAGFRVQICPEWGSGLLHTAGCAGYGGRHAGYNPGTI